MNIKEYLLTCTMEECSEIAQNVGKSLRFGINDRNIENPTGPTNRERLVDELNDLMGIIKMLIDNEILPIDWYSKKAQDAKIKKVTDLMDYSRKVGTLV